MPLYEYHCSKCGKTFELIRRFSDPPVTQHEECGGAVEQLLAAPAFQLKGSGWYVTDYAKSGKADANKDADAKAAKDSKGDSKSDSKDSKADSKSEGKSDSKSESKSESKTESKSGDSGGSTSESKSTKSESKPAPAKSDS